MNLRAVTNLSWRWRTIILSALIMTLPTIAAAQPAEAITILPLGDSRVEGVDAGGDDYLTKPFAFAELSARVNAANV